MRIAAPLLLPLLLAACADDGTRIHYTHYGHYSGSIAYYSARDGVMPLTVVGNPTNASNLALSAAVAAALAGTHVDHATVFAPTPQPDPASYRVVIVFGRTILQDICSPNPTPCTPGQVRAAFCYGDEPLSFVSAAHQPFAGPQDPALSRLVRQFGTDLFPPENPELRKNCGSIAGLCD